MNKRGEEEAPALSKLVYIILIGLLILGVLYVFIRLGGWFGA
jgi:hypothetical protein